MSEGPASLPTPSSLPGRRRLRFAPSPTGALHIGNVRTALFNYCLASPEGRFLLRIEDTDRERYRPESVLEYQAELRWLGLLWDEGPDLGGPCAPYVESERLPLYRTAADQLVAEGNAYPCFCSRERLEELRAAQRAGGLPTRYDRRCLHLSPDEVSELRAEGRPEVVRLRMPEGESAWDDLVLGPQRFDNAEIDDQVLLKSDGYPTYHLAHVVDDHLMGVTHVVRAVEWLPSTPKHLVLYRALGWSPPELAHVPLVLGPDRQKLAKRHGAAAVSEYREMGYLPEALVNFLAFLGWSPGTEEEVFTLPELRARMTFERLQSSPAVFDGQRLDYLNGVWIRRLSPGELGRRLGPFLPQASAEQLEPIAEMVQERIRRLDEVPGLLAFAWTDPEPSASMLHGSLSRMAAHDFLESALPVFERGPGGLMDALRSLASSAAASSAVGAKAEVRRLMRVVRIALTGQEVSPPLDACARLLGPVVVDRRLRRALEELRGSADL
ncbi:MAG: glutamate--tRNA ligase [Candidatus Dormibacteria bacterium]